MIMSARSRAISFVAMAATAWISSVHAQVPAHVDTSKTLTLSGTVVEFSVGPGPHSYLVIETKDSAGKPEAWALLGNPVGMLIKDGWNLKGAAPPGSSVSATAFALKSTTNAVDAVPDDAPARVVATAKAGRYVHGIDVTLSDGKTLTFGPSK